MIIAPIVFFCGFFAQTFEVASVKPSAPPEGGGRRMIRIGGGPGTSDPGRITYTGVPLMFILSGAYDVKNFQINGPSWLDSERFDITATVAPGTTKEQAGVMMQNLLAERFHLTVHREKKEMQGYELTVAKGGAKLKESAPDADEPPAPASGPPKRDANGRPILAGPGLLINIEMTPKGPMALMASKAQPLSQLVQMLGNQLKMPVVDKTGLTGKYDFHVEFSPDLAGMGVPPPSGGGSVAGPLTGDESGPDMMTAIRQQLGLRLDAKKMPVEMIVIEHVDKVPTEN
jgi:uncharacterized protein (TIGR03435 family)